MQYFEIELKKKKTFLIIFLQLLLNQNSKFYLKINIESCIWITKITKKKIGSERGNCKSIPIHFTSILIILL